MSIRSGQTRKIKIMKIKIMNHEYFTSNGELGIGTWKLCWANLIEVFKLVNRTNTCTPNRMLN